MKVFSSYDNETTTSNKGFDRLRLHSQVSTTVHWHHLAVKVKSSYTNRQLNLFFKKIDVCTFIYSLRENARMKSVISDGPLQRIQ